MPVSVTVRILLGLLTVAGLPGSNISAQDQKQALQQQLAAVKQSLAKNQQALRQYSWTETTVASLKGEEKSRTQKECHYGPDGTVVKTPLGPPRSGEKKRGLEGKVVEKKVGELKDYLDRAASLIHRYVPPDPAKMQEAFQSGKAALSRDAANGSTTIEFKDYEKPGDSLGLAFAQGQVKAVTVRSYLDDASDTVSLNASFQPLADGTNYMAESVLDGAAKKVQIRTTNFDHRKAGQ